MIIIVEFQHYAQKVIVLAVSREWCAFHVDNMWTSTMGRVSVSCGQGERGIKNRIFLCTSWMD